MDNDACNTLKHDRVETPSATSTLATWAVSALLALAFFATALQALAACKTGP
jgi:hypothetical protein